MEIIKCYRGLLVLGYQGTDSMCVRPKIPQSSRPYTILTHPLQFLLHVFYHINDDIRCTDSKDIRNGNDKSVTVIQLQKKILTDAGFVVVITSHVFRKMAAVSSRYWHLKVGRCYLEGYLKIYSMPIGQLLNE